MPRAWHFMLTAESKIRSVLKISSQANTRCPCILVLLFVLLGGQWRWSPWTDCSVSCGAGKQRRTGTCILPSTGQKLKRRLCDGYHHETRNCSNGDCPGKLLINDITILFSFCFYLEQRQEESLFCSLSCLQFIIEYIIT